MVRKVKGYIYSAKPEFKVANKDKRIIEGYFSTKDLDRENDIVLPSAFEKSLPAFVEKNGIVLFNHRYDYPIGKIIDYKIDDRGAFVRVEIAKGTQTAEEVWALIEQGILKTFSFGFLPIKTDIEEIDSKIVRILKEVDLLEVSIVSVPANTEAVFTIAEGKAINVEFDVVNDKEDKATPPFKDFPLADKSRPWDKSAAVARVRRWASSDGSGEKDKINWSKYKLAFFWYDESDLENFGSYKLPFVDIIDGKPHAIPRGVIAAAAAIQGARGGVDIPDKDVPAVKRHISKYYKKMDMTPPWENEGKMSDFEKIVLMEETIKAIVEDVIEDFAEIVFDELSEISMKVKGIEERFDKVMHNLFEKEMEEKVNKNKEFNDIEEEYLEELKKALEGLLNTLRK